jgi:hypothetical protein
MSAMQKVQNQQNAMLLKQAKDMPKVLPAGDVWALTRFSWMMTYSANWKSNTLIRTGGKHNASQDAF